jgi:hydroxyacylglutathione hydrolase
MARPQRCGRAFALHHFTLDIPARSDAMLEVHQFPCLEDNYGYLLHDPASGETACIDTPDGEEYLRQAAAKGWRITQIWNTHWHPDHAGGNAAIRAATGCTITAPATEYARIAAIAPVDRAVKHNETARIGAHTARVIDVGGHTNGHIAYHLPQAGIAFVGDAVFMLGCGRMFEGTAPQFWTSLSRIKALPPETVLYCAHEYTESNARFARHADPDNAALRAYADEVAEKRARGEWTVPARLERELAANPFLRADDPALQARWGAAGDAVATFAALRAAKDSF